MNYRGYIIEQRWIYTDPFTKVPTGKFDGMYYQEEDETARLIYRETLDQVKAEIDDLIFENTQIEVHHSRSLGPAKFDWYSEAYQFCKLWNLPLDSIKFFFKGQEVQFDSI